MKKSILSFLFLISMNVFADDLNGNWIGSGMWTFDGSGARCDMKLSFKDNGKILIRKPAYFDCEVVALQVPGASYTKQGEKLINENGEEVGSYIGNTITYKEAFDEKVNVYTTIVVKGLHFDYEEDWMFNDGRPLYKIKGRFFTNK